MDNGFQFGDYHTKDFGAKVEWYPPRTIPARKGETISIPGRNGNLHIFQNAYESYTQYYDIYFNAGELVTMEATHKIAAWLTAEAGYQILRDRYDIGHFRKAIFLGPMDIENILNQYGRCRVSFECAPQSYLDVGEEIKTFSESGTLDNPTKYEALPEITVYGSAAGTVNIGDMSVEILRITEPIILDSEMQDAYSKPGEGAAVNRNNDIKANDFPVIKPGTTNISFSGGIEKIEIKPRWWEL